MSERVLNRPRKRTDAVLDFGGNLADIRDRLAPVVEHAQIPIEAFLKLRLFGSGLAVIGVDRLLKGLVFGANAVGQVAVMIDGRRGVDNTAFPEAGACADHAAAG